MVKIKGRNLRVRIKMLEGEIPLLIEGKTMEDWNMKLDFENQVAKIRWGKEMIHYNYNVDEGGNIKMKLFEKEKRSWMSSDWRRNKDQWEKIHRQFAHPGKERLKKLISEGWGEEKKE